MPYLDFESLRRTVAEAVASNDVVAALTALRPAARAAASEQGASFRDLVATLPQSAWHDDPIIASAMGASFRAAGSPRGSAALGYFHAAEAALVGEASDRDLDRATVWLGLAAALRSLGHREAAREYVDRAKALEASDGIRSVPARVELGARCALEAGLLALSGGELDVARQLLEHVNGLAVSHLTRAEQVECLGGLALIEFAQANMDTAEGHVAEALALAHGTSLMQSCYVAPALAAAGLMAVTRSQLDTAVDIETLLFAAAHRNNWEPFAYVVGAGLRVQTGELSEALDYLHRARQGYLGWESSSLGAAIGDELRASILVTLDHGDEAWEILQNLKPLGHHALCPGRIIARLRLLHGDLRGAEEALAACDALGDDHSPRTLMDVRMLHAAIDFGRGDYVRSDLSFDRALAAMARTGSLTALRIIPSGTLKELSARAQNRTQGEAATRILSRVAEATGNSKAAIEALSQREMLVLAEVEKGSTVAAMAAALYISSNTVKTHLRRLYKKLGVSTRAEAIRKAKSLGLGQSVTRDSPARGGTVEPDE